MKPGIVITAVAVAILLLGSLLYWKTRPVGGSGAGSQPPDSPGIAGSPSVLSLEAPGSAEGATSPDRTASARSAAAPAPTAEPVLEADLASHRAEPGTEIALPASIEDQQQAWAETLAKKYEGIPASDRVAARDSLRALLFAHQAGELGKGETLTDEQIQEFKREIEWLSLHENP